MAYKKSDLIGLTSLQSPLKCAELVRRCEEQCARFAGLFLESSSVPVLVRTCLGEQNLAGVYQALDLGEVLQMAEVEVDERAAIASSLLVILWRGACRSSDRTCLWRAAEALIDFVCIVGLSHFVAMGVMNAYKSEDDGDAADSDEEVIWGQDTNATGAGEQGGGADVEEESEEAARERRVLAQQERKSSVRWDYTGGYRAAEIRRPETNEEATLRLINARNKGLQLGVATSPTAPTAGEEEKTLRFKTDLCKFFERGNCDKGVRCSFAHGYEELRNGGSKAASDGLFVHHGPSWESGPPVAEKASRKKI